MPNWLLDFAKSQSRSELSLQYDTCRGVETNRLILAVVPFAIAAIYLPFWLCAGLAVLNAILETMALRMMKGLEPPARPGRYLRMLATYAAAQVVYGSIYAMVWQNPDSFAKSLAIGIFLVNLVHLSTVRTVHLPLTFASLVTSTIIAIIGNTYFWIASDNLPGLMISSFCLVAAIYFVLVTIKAVHGLYSAMSRGRQDAEAATEAKSRFLAQMSHELRTPLNAILGMGYAELTIATQAQSKERLATLVQSASSLSVLLNDIVDLSTLEAGQLPIRPTAVDLRAETNATVALFRQQVAEAGMTLNVAFTDNVPRIGGIDAQRYRQCLSNLLSNAVKYSQSDGVDVTVTAPTPGRVEVVVADRGPGVPEMLREKIFEPFQRGDSLVAGSGLGLSISRTLARRMGGDLVLAPGQGGASFILSFALAPLPPDTIPPPVRRIANLTGVRVLVVDDVATNRLVAMTYLRIMHATATEAPDGPTALAMIATDPPDVVLLDMLMPGMDGAETLDNIRRMPGASARLPVIAMTADATEEHRHLCLALGMNGYVTKPLSAESLSAAVLAVLPDRNG
jgi:signal transduction histidine kinase/CheY-like chemotaxis protein